jgi:hypothetical protein
MKYRVFIHTNPKQQLGAIVGRFTMKAKSAHAEAFDVELLNTTEYTYLDRYHGKPYLREGKKAKWDKDDLQSFTPLRFLPPQVMGYSGRAIVTDPDVFALKDIHDLLTLDLKGKAIAARKIRPKDGRPEYWASSVMLLDCSKLKHWKWEQQVDDMFRFKIDYRDWMSLWLEDQSTILELPEEWNHYDVMNERTRLLHNTARITQPWKTGLPVDFDFTKKKPPVKWGRNPRGWLKILKNQLNPPPAKPFPKQYKPHPDRGQERYFFENLKELVRQGELTEDMLKDAMAQNHLRKDALELLHRL